MSDHKQARPPWALIKDAADHADQRIIVKGWLDNKRSSGKVRFLVVRDGTGIMQCVLSLNEMSEADFEIFDQLTQESSLMVTGLVREDKRAPGGWELTADGLTLVHKAEDYPITPKEHGPDFLLSRRHLWLRSRRQRAIMMIRAELIRSVRDFFDSRGFVLIDTPILTPAACEGTTTLFATDYFEHGSAYLTQSGQLYAEAAAMAMGRVYTFGPTFRAEKSKTRRHLTEFWMIEPEAAWLDLWDLMDLAEDFVESITQRVVQNRRADLELLERDVSALEKIRRPFARITYDAAVESLRGKGAPIKWGDDFGAPDEQMLVEGHDTPVLVHHWPKESKAFYMKTDPEQDNLVLAVDMLAPEGYGEIIGGSQREDDLKTLTERMRQEKLPFEPMEWYLDLRRYGSVPHSGFGLGLERVVSWICGLKHVREAIPFPRMIDRFYP